MKKIIHISNFNILRFKGCFQVGMPYKISNGLIRNGYAVYNYADRDLSRMFGFGHMNFYGNRKVNKHLVDYCKVVEPDVIILGHADSIDEETLLAIKEIFPSLKILQWTCDWVVPNVSLKTINSLQKNLKAVDAVFVTTGDREMLSQFKTENNIVGYLPNIADSALETGRAFTHRSLPHDILLCAHRDRRQFCGQVERLQDIVDESVEKIEGVTWRLGGFNSYPELYGFGYLRALQESAMGFNISNVNDVYLYSSDRMIHFMANGVLTLVDKRNGFQDIFSEDEVAYYETREEFFEKIEYFKRNPEERMRVAGNGYHRVHSEFSNVAITQYMMDILFNKEVAEEQSWQILLK